MTIEHPRRKPAPCDDRVWLHTRYIENHRTCASIAREAGVHRSRVEKQIREFGFPLKGHKKYHWPAEELINKTPIGCYAVGFIFADGSLSEKQDELRIILQAKDRPFLEELVSRINSPVPVAEFSGSGRNSGHRYCRTRLVGAKGHLQDEYGLTSNKVENGVRFPYQLDEEQLRHFLRGFFDGDGSLAKSKIAADGSQLYSMKIACTDQEFVWDIADRVADHTGYMPPIYDYQPSEDAEVLYSLEGGALKYSGFLDWMYQPGDFALRRKWVRHCREAGTSAEHSGLY